MNVGLRRVTLQLYGPLQRLGEVSNQTHGPWQLSFVRYKELQLFHVRVVGKVPVGESGELYY